MARVPDACNWWLALTEISSVTLPLDVPEINEMAAAAGLDVESFRSAGR